METLEALGILDRFSEMSKKLETLAQKIEAPRHSFQSSDMKELFGALAKAQSEMEIAGLNNKNPFFKSKYADLASVVKASRPYLSKNGLSVIQHVVPNEEGHNILHTKLCHASGQWIESRMRIVPPKPDIQSLGSYLTYLRRYSYAALVGIVASEEDDDGESAMTEMRHGSNPVSSAPMEFITKEQLEELHLELKGYEELAKEILDRMNLKKLAEMPKNKYSQSIKRIREIKEARNEK